MRWIADALAQLGLDDSLVAWAAERESLADVWAQCPRGDWLLALAARVGAPRPQLVRAGLDCARLAQRFVPPGERRPGFALAAAERWLDGALRGTECWAAAFQAAGAASEMAPGDEAAAHAAMAAACVAFACDAEADDVYYGARAHVAEAATLVARAYQQTRIDAHLACARLVRGHVALQHVSARLDRAVGSSLPPAPPAMGHPRAERTPLWFDPDSFSS